MAAGLAVVGPTVVAEEGSAMAGTLRWLGSRANHSWLEQLRPDPETAAHEPNKQSRQVKSGHYVAVRPTPLPNPKLVIFSRSMASALGLSEEECSSPNFARFFSGDTQVEPELKTWCTPYALSIYGQEMYDNCPFKNGNGYGDGRAVSVGEVLLPDGARWEMQLKGGGTTPFCRRGDGRAVLRSSIREFLASEAMFNMNVSTTRALSLVVSESEQVARPWYSNSRDVQQLPDVDDPRLAAYPMPIRRALLAQLQSQMRDPDMMQNEQCAITCRVAPSFLRIGHVELFGRRFRKDGTDKSREELELIVQHLLFREYPEIDAAPVSLQQKIPLLMEEVAKRLSTLVADWLRVGFCQGNFNSDNCLASGRTMDYGPFGFIEKFEPTWNMWSGGGEHFSFMNQPAAAGKNFESLATAVLPLCDEAGRRQVLVQLHSFPETVQNTVNAMWQRKLGLASWGAAEAALFSDLQDLMVNDSVDYTLLWRQLAELPLHNSSPTDTDEALLGLLRPAFYAQPNEAAWAKWLRTWLQLLPEGAGSDVGARMKTVSPKYVPREWMMVHAYTAANQGDYTGVHELHKLFERPFDEQPEMEDKYYRRAPDKASQVGGTGFMS